MIDIEHFRWMIANSMGSPAWEDVAEMLDEIEKLRAELKQAEDRIISLQYERPMTSGYGEVQ